MPTKPIERFLFAQGGICFFCKATLAKSEATVEHLVATSRGGSNSDDNCVACCKAINTLLGNMSIKEKIKVVLNQNGQFKCPNAGTKQTTATPLAPKKKPAPKSKDPLLAVVKNLKSRSKGRPQKVTIISGVDGAWGFNEAAHDAASRSTYTPATRDGKPVAGFAVVEYLFGASGRR